MVSGLPVNPHALLHLSGESLCRSCMHTRHNVSQLTSTVYHNKPSLVSPRRKLEHGQTKLDDSLWSSGLLEINTQERHDLLATGTDTPSRAKGSSIYTLSGLYYVTKSLVCSQAFPKKVSLAYITKDRKIHSW